MKSWLALLAITLPLMHTTPQPALRTQVVMLGTGTPIPNPDRSGPAVAVIVDDAAYLFDAGSGVVRRAAAAGRAGVKAFAPAQPGGQPSPRFERIFITHLHSDHTLGLADAIFTPWIQGREAPIDVYGPPGLARLVQSILDGNADDIQERIAAPAGPSKDGWRARAHEVKPGEIFRDARVTVRAFAVPHSKWPQAFGYRIDTPDRSIVISGDTVESDAVAAACDGCDILIHEAISDAAFRAYPPERQAYHGAAHTLASQVGRVATKGRAKLLVLTHVLSHGVADDVVMAEVKSTYAGPVVFAKDLDVVTGGAPARTAVAGQVRGRVFDEFGASIPEASVSFQPWETTSRLSTFGATTDVRGRFDFGGVAPGVYRVTATALGYETTVMKQEVVAGVETEVTIVVRRRS